MKRSGPLKRSTPLSRAAFRRRVALITTRRKQTGFDRATKARIVDRDGSCVMCGLISDPRDLVAHHRRNRGAGGSTDPDTNSVRNGLALCWGCNGLAESSATHAAEARERGIKLRIGQGPDTPVQYPDHYWWRLLPDGQRRRLGERAA